MSPFSSEKAGPWVWPSNSLILIKVSIHLPTLMPVQVLSSMGEDGKDAGHLPSRVYFLCSVPRSMQNDSSPLKEPTYVMTTYAPKYNKCFLTWAWSGSWQTMIKVSFRHSLTSLPDKATFICIRLTSSHPLNHTISVGQQVNMEWFCPWP